MVCSIFLNHTIVNVLSFCRDRIFELEDASEIINLFLHFVLEEVEAQKGEVTCLLSLK